MRPAEPRKSSFVAPLLAPIDAPFGTSSDDVPHARPPLPAPAAPLAHNPPRPIGTEALRRLRDAIQSGEYPSDGVVRSGLERLIRRED